MIEARNGLYEASKGRFQTRMGASEYNCLPGGGMSTSTDCNTQNGRSMANSSLYIEHQGHIEVREVGRSNISPAPAELKSTDASTSTSTSRSGRLSEQAESEQLPFDIA